MDMDKKKTDNEQKLTGQKTSGRKLTEKEKKRAEIVNAKIQSYIDKGYSVTDMTIDLAHANTMALVYGAPLIILFIVCWCLKYSYVPGMILDLVKSVPFVAALLASIVVHELVHGFFWGIFAEGHYKSIEFGMAKLTAYCTCLVPLSISSYLIGGLAPCIILGIIPCAAGLALNNFYIFAIGILQLLGAGGDLQIAAKLISYHSSKKEKLCIDHPTEIGMMIIEK